MWSFFSERENLNGHAALVPAAMGKDWRKTRWDSGGKFGTLGKKSHYRRPLPGCPLSSLSISASVIFIVSKDVHYVRVLVKDGEVLPNLDYAVFNCILSKLSKESGFA